MEGGRWREEDGGREVEGGRWREGGGGREVEGGRWREGGGGREVEGARQKEGGREGKDNTDVHKQCTMSTTAAQFTLRRRLVRIAIKTKGCRTRGHTLHEALQWESRIGWCGGETGRR